MRIYQPGKQSHSTKVDEFARFGRLLPFKDVNNATILKYHVRRAVTYVTTAINDSSGCYKLHPASLGGRMH